MRPFLSSCLLLSLSCCISPTLQADELRYSPKEGTLLGYEITIAIGGDPATASLIGRSTYQVESTGQKIALAFQGGLKLKQASSGGRCRGPSRLISPRSPFTGISNARNQLTILPTGEVVEAKGDSQLPFLLGNLSHLLIERLPENGGRTWTVKTDIAITESNSRVPRPGPGRGSVKHTKAEEVTTYNLQGSEAGKAVIAKTYDLTTPGGEGKFEIHGKGMLTFNTERVVAERLEFKQTVTSRKGDKATETPLKIQYRLLDDAEMIELVAERKARTEQLQKLIAERKKKQAEGTDAPKPRTERAKTRPKRNVRQVTLNAQQKKRLFGFLESDDPGRIRLGLMSLNRMAPKEPDEEVTEVLRPLLKHENETLKSLAEQAWENWGIKQTSDEKKPAEE